MATSTVMARRKGYPQHKVEGKTSLCSKNRLGKNGSLFKVNGVRGPYEKKRKTWENYSGRFTEGSKQRKPNNDDKHGHGQEKRRPTTLS